MTTNANVHTYADQLRQYATHFARRAVMTALGTCPRCDRPTEWIEERALCDPKPRLWPAAHVCRPDDLEAASRLRYRLRIEHERSLGAAYVGRLLDQLCTDLGLDPVETWRRIHYGHIVLDPAPYWTIGGSHA